MWVPIRFRARNSGPKALDVGEQVEAIKHVRKRSQVIWWEQRKSLGGAYSPPLLSLELQNLQLFFTQNK